MRTGDRFAYKEYEELVGRLGPDGKPDPPQGALRRRSFYGSLLDYFDREASGAAPPELKITDGRTILTVNEAKNPLTYRTAREPALEKGATIVVEGEGDWATVRGIKPSVLASVFGRALSATVSGADTGEQYWLNYLEPVTALCPVAEETAA